MQFCETSGNPITSISWSLQEIGKYIFKLIVGKDIVKDSVCFPF